MRISSASVVNRGTAKQSSHAFRLRTRSLRVAAGQPDLSRAPLGVVWQRLQSLCFCS